MQRRHRLLGSDGELLVVFSDKKAAEKAAQKAKLTLKEPEVDEGPEPDILMDSNYEVEEEEIDESDDDEDLEDAIESVDEDDE